MRNLNILLLGIILYCIHISTIEAGIFRTSWFGGNNIDNTDDDTNNEEVTFPSHQATSFVPPTPDSNNADTNDDQIKNALNSYKKTYVPGIKAEFWNNVTMEDYYDKTTNTQDIFMAGLSQKITSHINNENIIDLGKFTDNWNHEGDNSIINQYRGDNTSYFDSIDNNKLNALTARSEILQNQVTPGQFDASELLAYNDEDYFIKYSMITKNKYASYTDDNFLIGFKDEPNKEPYCKLTVNGSIKNTKSIVVTDAKYNDSDFMNTMKNTLDNGTVFTEGLIVSDRRSDVNNREVNGLYCRGDITTAGTFGADIIGAREIEATEKLKIGTFEINNNGTATGSGLTLGESLSAGSATITGAITADSANINGALGCGSFTLSSDKRLKENIVDLKDEIIDNIRPVKFNWKNGENKKDVLGVIAQEVDEVYPDVINKTGEFMKVDYIQFIPILIKEVQDLKKMNKILMAKIDLLEKN